MCRVDVVEEKAFKRRLRMISRSMKSVLSTRSRHCQRLGASIIFPMSRDEREKTARNKAITAVSTGVGAVIVGASIGPMVGIATAAGAAYLGYDWFMHRAKHGMRF
eukprot:g74147.t1